MVSIISHHFCVASLSLKSRNFLFGIHLSPPVSPSIPSTSSTKGVFQIERHSVFRQLIPSGRNWLVANIATCSSAEVSQLLHWTIKTIQPESICFRSNDVFLRLPNISYGLAGFVCKDFSFIINLKTILIP